MIEIVSCTPDDLPMLARMNRMLIEDERAENAMTLPELERRMAGFLSSGYRAFFFQAEGSLVGYALVDPSRKPLYLRQFFICRESRKAGHGRASFHALLSLLQTSEIDLDVYAWNEAGLAFWKALGFSVRCHGMRFEAFTVPKPEPDI